MPRILAIDYGQKRTGIAVTDELQIIASGLTTIPSATAIDFLKDYFTKEKVEAVTNIYNFLNVKELARKEMEKHYELALTFLKDIPVDEKNKKELIAFADSLMIREM